MKSKLTTLGMLAAALLWASAALAEGRGRGRPEGNDRGRGPEDRGRPEGHDRGRGRGHQMHRRMLERFDADKDGRLSESERAAAREWLEENRPKPGELRDKIDTDGDGKISDEERQAARERHLGRLCRHLIERFDKDGDDKLCAKELAAALQWLRARRRHPGPGHRRPGPPPWSNAGGEGRGPRDRQGPPPHSNAGGEGRGPRDRRGPPPHSNAGGRGSERPAPFLGE